MKGLLHEKHQEFTRLFKEIFRTLQYKTYAKVLNSKDYAIPQSRRIVAVLGSAMQSKFRWPKSIQHSKRTLSKFLDVSEEGSEIADVSTHEQKHGEEIWVKPYILDVASSPKFRSAQPRVCPCLTRSRLKVHPSGCYLPKPGGRPAARLAPQVARQVADAVWSSASRRRAWGWCVHQRFEQGVAGSLSSIGEREMCGRCPLPLLTRQCSPHRTFEEIGWAAVVVVPGHGKTAAIDTPALALPRLKKELRNGGRANVALIIVLLACGTSHALCCMFCLTCQWLKVTFLSLAVLMAAKAKTQPLPTGVPANWSSWRLSSAEQAKNPSS